MHLSNLVDGSIRQIQRENQKMYRNQWQKSKIVLELALELGLVAVAEAGDVSGWVPTQRPKPPESSFARSAVFYFKQINYNSNLRLQFNEEKVKPNMKFRRHCALMET